MIAAVLRCKRRHVEPRVRPGFVALEGLGAPAFFLFCGAAANHLQQVLHARELVRVLGHGSDLASHSLAGLVCLSRAQSCLDVSQIVRYVPTLSQNKLIDARQPLANNAREPEK